MPDLSFLPLVMVEKESKLLRSWLLDLSLQSFLLEYSRAEHGQCLCLTVQSSHCRATTRFAHVDLGAPDSGHHLYSEKSCGQIQKGASETVTGLRQNGMTGLVLQKFLTGLCFRDLEALSSIFHVYIYLSNYISLQILSREDCRY